MFKWIWLCSILFPFEWTELMHCRCDRRLKKISTSYSTFTAAFFFNTRFLLSNVFRSSCLLPSPWVMLFGPSNHKSRHVEYTLNWQKTNNISSPLGHVLAEVAIDWEKASYNTNACIAYVIYVVRECVVRSACVSFDGHGCVYYMVRLLVCVLLLLKYSRFLFIEAIYHSVFDPQIDAIPWMHKYYLLAIDAVVAAAVNGFDSMELASLLEQSHIIQCVHDV